VSWHFWLATLGIVLYASSMWVSGIMQGLMWREYDDQGFLVYSFAESVAAMYPYYIIRMLGGLLFLLGSLVMVYNLVRTLRGDRSSESAVGTPVLAT
jgi:cytochrome c oxidase cbb3-type subunit 1